MEKTHLGAEERAGKRIWIALADDWELRGNGLGDVRTLQYDPAMRLMELYEDLGVRGTFNVEVMQQLAFERVAARFPEIAGQRDLWNEAVQQMTRRGFDVQLHLHPQWHAAEYADGFWRLDRRWNIAEYPAEEVDRFVREGLEYLSRLVPTPIRVFRAGSWGIGPPSRGLFEALERHGIRMDVSIVQGIRYDGECMQLDYTGLESPYAPYYPDYDDGRRVASRPTGVVEVPTQSVAPAEVRFSAVDRLRRRAEATASRWIQRASRIRASRGPQAAIPEHVPGDPFGFRSGRARGDYIFDLSSNYPTVTFLRMADSVIGRAAAAEGPVFLVFENHTKDLTRGSDFRRIRRVLRHIRREYDDVAFVTLGEMAENLDRIRPLAATGPA